MEIKAAGHNTLFGIAQGTLLVVVHDTQDVCRTVKLPIVLVPDLLRNLILIAMTAQKGVETVFTKAGSIVDLGLFSVQLTRSDNLDHLDLAISKESKRTESACCAISGKLFSKEIMLTASVPQKPVPPPTESINLCHRRLGHPNETILRKVRDLMDSRVKCFGSFMSCSACKTGKSTQRPPAKNTSHDWVTEPLQVVTTDLMGPISPAALGNSNYMTKFMGMYSRFSAVYFLKNKSSSSILDSFIKFERNLAIPFGRRVQYLRSDQGTEYTNRNFKKYYCKRTRAIQQFTALYTPQQNGISERAGRTVMDRTRCFFTETGLPKHLWGELASTVVFQKNVFRIVPLVVIHPTICCLRKMPIFLLRVIGSRAFVYEEGHRGKLDQKAWEGVLVGYNNDSPTYRIYGNTNGKIVSSRNVAFIECVESNTPSMFDDIDEGSKRSDDLENVYYRIQNLESTTLDNVEGSHGPVHQHNRMSLRSSRKSKDNLAEAKSLNSRESRSENQLAMSTSETVSNYIYTVQCGYCDLVGNVKIIWQKRNH